MHENTDQPTEKKLTEEQQAIADVIEKHFLPGTLEEYDDVVEIDEFVELWPEDERPELADIEEVMELLGFKDENSRLELDFLVLIPDDEEEESEQQPQETEKPLD